MHDKLKVDGGLVTTASARQIFSTEAVGFLKFIGQGTASNLCKIKR